VRRIELPERRAGGRVGRGGVTLAGGAGRSGGAGGAGMALVTDEAALSNRIPRAPVALAGVDLVGALPAFDGDGAISTAIVGFSGSAAGLVAADISAPPQAMQTPLRRGFTVPQLGQFQVMAGICRAILSGLGLSRARQG
jgi:hypothetical protein